MYKPWLNFRLLTLFAVVFLTPTLLLGTQANPPNVLFIAVDDLNDWVGVFGGNPQAKTPHLDQLAAEGAVVFQNAHCPGPVCGPSRSALLSGFMPHRTGAYGNSQNMWKSRLVEEHATLPEYFSKHGYITVSTGKIFHKQPAKNGTDHGQWAYDVWEHETGAGAVNSNRLYSRNKGIRNGQKVPNPKHTESGGTEFAWGPTKAPLKETKDYRSAVWAAQQLKGEFDEPFFMAIGISKPHLPWFVPQEFFDRYNLAQIKIPDFRLDDLEDILTPRGKQKFSPSEDFLWVKDDKELFRRAVQAYLAATSYADTCVGVIFDALRASHYWDNTIIIVWGDHGWHLGEKLKFRKGTLWSEATRLPLMVRLPHMSQREDSPRLVNLIDLYPTLIGLCGLPTKEGLDGRSFVPLLKEPQREWPYPTLTIRGEGSFTLLNERWRYIHHEDGTEEVYDLERDPLEHDNLIQKDSDKAQTVKKQFAAWVPKSFAPGLPRNDPGASKSRPPDSTLKAQRDLSRLR
jgi:arylsulfatase A-like enzyme